MRPVWWVTLVIGGGWLWLFRGPLLGNQVCALRDAGNFYYPLFQWQVSEWGAGRIPLWNPWDGLGVPALADATSSVLYPGKLLFLLPGSFAWRFSLYIALHVLLAAGTLYFAARRWRGTGASEYAAGLGAVSYAFGGIVLFQHCNVVFLVSAAWLPLGLWLIDRCLNERRVDYAIGLGGVLALMTLGGDPQTAYHTGLVGALYAGLLWLREQRAVLAGGATGLCRHRLSLLVIAAVVTWGLSAAQVWPTWDWTRRSERVVYSQPRSVYEWLGVSGEAAHETATRAGSGLWGWPAAEGHASRIYRYSVGPWRWLELLWPNFGGRAFPFHRRWMSRLPAEDAVWTPTLYGGSLVTVMLAVTLAGSCRRGWLRVPLDAVSATRDLWLWGCLAAGLLGSLGWFGVGWFVEWTRHELGVVAEPGQLGPPVGGLYWWCVTVLPGYVYFRYPAKWLVFVAVAASLLAALAADRVSKIACLRAVLGWGAVVGGSTVGVGLVAGRLCFMSWCQPTPPNDLFGPFDAGGAWTDLVVGFAQATLVLLAATGASWWADRRGGNVVSWWFLIAACDLIAANSWLIATVPSETMRVPARGAAAYRALFLEQDHVLPPRVAHPPDMEWTSPDWRRMAAANRLEAVVAWERDRLLFQHHLSERIPVRDARGTIDLARLASAEMPAQEASQSPSLAAVGERQVPPEFSWIADSARPRLAFVSEGPEDRTRWMVRHNSPQQLEVDIEAETPGIFVMDDRLDSDWRFESTSSVVSNSGRAVEVLDGDSRRRVRLAAGRHRLTWTYRPRSFYFGSLLSFATLATLGGGWLRGRSRRM